MLRAIDVTFGDADPPGPCVTVPTSFVVVSTLQFFSVLGTTECDACVGVGVNATEAEAAPVSRGTNAV